jgi:Vitamin K-dependent gamma-carboxylase
MIRRNLQKGWDDFFFAPQSPLPIALFRIFYGICVLATVLLLHADWLEWFGVHSWVSLSTVRSVEPGIRLNLFTLIPQDDRWIAAFFWVFVGFAVLLILGLWTRISSIAVFLCVASIDQRNLFINHSGDTFLRVAGFFLMFAPAGAALSLDRLIRMRKRLADPEIVPVAPWAQRMIQCELALLYLVSCWWKMKGDTWLQGTALYYVTHLHAMKRFPLPAWALYPWVLKVEGWFIVALEFCLGTLIWVRRFRYPLLLMGLLFHLSIEYAINIPMFQWNVLSAYILFVDPADIVRVWSVIRQRVRSAGVKR